MSDLRSDWKIYILAHKQVHQEYFEQDKYFNNTNYEIFNVNTRKDVEIEGGGNLKQITQRKFKNFKELGFEYAESEGLWNLWREGIHKKLKYIGFIHYDVDINNPNNKKLSLTKEINKYIEGKNKVHIIFLNFNPKQEWETYDKKQNVKPLISGQTINYYQYVLDDYNEYFKTNYTKEDFKSKSQLSLCSCFFLDTETFDKMMSFYDYVIRKGRLKAFNCTKDSRIPGILAERYFGTFLLFEYKDNKVLTLNHRGVTTCKKCGMAYKRIKINLFGIKYTTKVKAKTDKDINKIVEVDIVKFLTDFFKRNK